MRYKKKHEDISFDVGDKHFRLKWENEYRAYIKKQNKYEPLYLGSVSTDNLIRYITKIYQKGEKQDGQDV